MYFRFCPENLIDWIVAVIVISVFRFKIWNILPN